MKFKAGDWYVIYRREDGEWDVRPYKREWSWVLWLGEWGFVLIAFFGLAALIWG
jgi:hypothetical protein